MMSDYDLLCKAKDRIEKLEAENASLRQAIREPFQDFEQITKSLGMFADAIVKNAMEQCNHAYFEGMTKTKGANP